jgi:ATP-dependent protease ClpP protease subunit
MRNHAALVARFDLQDLAAAGPRILALKPSHRPREWDLVVYGFIGDGFLAESVTAKSVVEQLGEMPADVTQVNVRLNSPGGSVFDGLAIYNALKALPHRVVVTVDGIAGSIASLIAMAGASVRMHRASMFMVHGAMTGAFGNAKEHRKAAEYLEQVNGVLADAYAGKTGKPVDSIRTMLNDGVDHFYAADESVAFGFADEIVAEVELEAVAVDARALTCALLKEPLANVSFAIARQAVTAMLRGRVPADVASAFESAESAPGDDMFRKNLVFAALGAALLEPAAAPEAPTGGSAPAAAPPPPAAAAPATVAVASPAATAAATTDAIAERNRQVHAALNPHRATVPAIAALYDAAMLDPTMTVDVVRQRALDALGAASTPIAVAGGVPRVNAGDDARDKFRTGATQALAARGGLLQREATNEFNGMTLCALAAHSLTMAGVSVRGMSNDQIARRVLAAQSTSDFPLIASNTAGKALRKGYEAAPSTYERWCAVGSVSDFKAHPRLQLGSFNSLATILPGGEYTYGTFAEEGESITATTKGKGLKLTRQLLVNDDLGAFLQASQRMGRAARRTVNVDVYTLWMSGSGNKGPTMSDTGQLFNSTAVTTAGGHANYVEGAGTTLSGVNIALGRTAMRRQQDPSLREILNIAPRFLITPVTLEDTAWAILNSTADPSSSNPAKRNYVKDVANLELVTDPLLDASSITAWSLVADPGDVPVVEVDFLDGNSTPYIDDAIDWDTDAMKLKVRLDYGLSAIDWRGGYRSKGAA